jgi:hypothetical protein
MGMLCDSTQDAETKECVAPVSNNTFAFHGCRPDHGLLVLAVVLLVLLGH